MPRRMPVLATADEIRRIAENAEALIDAVYGEDDDDEDNYDPDARSRNRDRIEAAIAALRFCALAAGQLGDPALLPMIIESIETCERFDDHADDHPSTLGRGLTLLLKRGAPADAEVKRLAGHRDARIRQAVAEGLPARGEAEIALLEVLSTDAIAQVRNIAKKTLSAVREVAWWKGKFASDPVARLSPEDAERLKPTLERLSTILDMPRYALDEHEEELVKLAGALPDALAVEVVEMVLSTPDPYGLRLVLLGTMMLERPLGAAAFIRICEAICKGSRFVSSDHVAEMLLPLPREPRVAVCKEIITYLIALPEKVRSSNRESAVWPLSEAVAKAWPPGYDLTPVLDALLSLPPTKGHDHDWVLGGLSDVFKKEDADPTPIVERALEARLAGFPGTWRNFQGSINTMLERVSGPLLRPVAERAILSDNKDNIEWGIEQLVTRAHDPSRDPTPAEMIARFFAEPRYHDVIEDSSTLQKLVVPILRLLLREGRLAFEAACTALTTVGSIYGGVAQWSFRRRLGRDTEEESARRREEEIAKLDAFLGPKELRGPPTDEEWRALRAARAAYMAENDHDVTMLLRPLPVGPWAAEDRAARDHVLDALRKGDSDAASVLALALLAKPEEADLPLWDTVLELCEPEERSFIRDCQRSAADQLGISVAAKGGEPQNDDDDEGWGDEPEEDD